jgi:hypothetical protein
LGNPPEVAAEVAGAYLETVADAMTVFFHYTLAIPPKHVRVVGSLDGLVLPYMGIFS